MLPSAWFVKCHRRYEKRMRPHVMRTCLTPMPAISLRMRIASLVIALSSTGRYGRCSTCASGLQAVLAEAPRQHDGGDAILLGLQYREIAIGIAIDDEQIGVRPGNELAEPSFLAQ